MSRNVVLVVGTLQAGGAERAISGIANYWARKHWRITMVTLTGPCVQDFYPLVNGIDRRWLDDGRTAATRLARLRTVAARLVKLRKLLREVRPNAIVSFIDVPNVLTLLAASGLGVRTVVSERGSPQEIPTRGFNALGAHWRWLVKLLYRRAAVVTALNPAAAAWLHRHCGVVVNVVPLALRSMPLVDCQRERRLVYIGRLHREKGVDLLLRAFAAVGHEFPDWRVTVIGTGPERQPLDLLASELEITDRVEFLEPVVNVESWMARAGIVVLPSRAEAFGNVMLEAMAMGAPVIGTECPGPRALIDDGHNGRIVPVDDPVELARAMTELMSQSELRARLGREALKVREKFQQESVMSQWEALLFPPCDVEPP